MDERRERLTDVLVIAVAILIGALMTWQSLGTRTDTQGALRAEVRLMEQRGIVQDATMALPAETRAAIGIDVSPTPGGVLGQQGSTWASALAEMDTEVLQTSAAVELRLVWVALAAAWRQDALARSRIAEVANDPAQLAAHRGTLDELLRLANGKGTEALASLEATFEGLGASRWLLGHVRERHLANIGDAGAAPLAAEVTAIAQDAVGRWTLMSGLELFLFPTLGLIVLVLFPMFVRTRLVERGLAADLVPSPFRVERSWRVFFAWFVGFQVVSIVLVMILSLVTAGPQMTALTMALGSLASAAIAFALIELWARVPRDERSVATALGLARGARLKTLLVWLIPGISLAMALVRAADYLNLVVLQRQPETQDVVQLVIDQGSPALMLLIGLGAVVLAPLAEEVVFRGFLFRNLRDSLGKGLGMVISGFAFAAVHFEPTLILPLTALGIALAVLYEWSGSLYVPIAVHALWNLIALVKIELWRI